MQLTSKRIEVADALECIEHFYRENMTDGLPVVPPTEERVQQFIAAVNMQPDTEIANIAERAARITAEKLAINAVMAGCLPEYMPVLVAAVEALADPLFKFNHLASLGSPWPMVIVSGPMVRTLGMNHGRYVFGSGNRANATIGRAISLLLWNCCELRPDAIQRGDLESAKKSFERALAMAPDDPDALNLYGATLLQSGQPAAALDFLQRAAQRRRNDPHVLGNLAQTYFALAKYDEARETFRKAGRLDPRSLQFPLGVATSFAMQGDLAAAEKLLQSLAARFPDASLVWFNLGNVQRDSQRAADALASLDRKSTRLNSSHSQQSRMPSSA